MSRKSRIHAQERAKRERGFARFGLIVLGLVIAAFFALSVATYMQDDPSHTPVSREEAVRAEVTLLDANRVRWRGLFYRLRFTDHEPLRINFGAEHIKGAEDWPTGTRLTLLLHPLDESCVMSLTKDGTELIRFDDYLATLPMRRIFRIGVTVLLSAMSMAGAAALGVWYTRRIRQINQIRQRI